MLSLAKIIGDAQRAADGSGQAHTVLNLNTAGAPMYVIRDYPGEGTLAKAVERNGKRFLVAVVRPDAPPDMRGGYTLP